MAVELHSLTIKDLEARYGVTRSNIYNRIKGLKDKGYPMEPEKLRGKSAFNADQVRVMDALDSHIKAGHDIAGFPTAGGATVSQDTGRLSHRMPDSTELSYVLQDTQALSHSTQDTYRIDESKMLGELLGALTALPASRPDPLANLEQLERVAEKGWLLSTSQLAPLLGLKALSGKEFSRYGFTFTRVGRNGAESAWRVEKGID